VPAAIKREVFVRDGGCCSYVDERGVRCRETRYLELHHVEPYARGGQHVAANLTLRCAAHNALAAENDFGRVRVERMRASTRHESFAAEGQAQRCADVGVDI
jgi:5-methylcytosine-specific restriction endonuclease McrA